VKIMLLPALLIVGIAFGQSTSSASSVPAAKPAHIESAEQVKPKLLALLFRADWCPDCKVLEPQYKPLQNRFDKEHVLFASFDFTNDETTKEARNLATRLGVEPIYDQFRGITGIALLVDPSTNAIVAEITIKETPDQMKAIFTNALGPKPR
jgi:thiol-disulfide isomerase/thioredoxin